MLAVLAADWSLLLVRACLALLFGVAVLVSPESRLIVWFTTYTLVDGSMALIIAIHTRNVIGFGSWLLEALVRFAAAFVVMFMADQWTTLPVPFIAAWAALSGIGQILASVILSKELSGDWPLPTMGTLSLSTAVLLWSLHDEGARTMVWVIGLYGVLFGLALMPLAVRLRHLAPEIAKA
jgi:uncharacterized membrane protein HdeD (DUF308 family)